MPDRNPTVPYLRQKICPDKMDRPILPNHHYRRSEVCISNLALFEYQQYLEFREFHLHDGESFLKPVLIKTSKNRKINELFRIFFSVTDFIFLKLIFKNI